MGIVDKIKNLFYEDEIVEVPKETTKEDITIQKKEETKEKKDELDEVVSERDLLKSETTFKFPVIFEDEDFMDMKQEKAKIKPKEELRETKNRNTNSNYKKPTLDREVIREVIEKPKKFSPSPVISPVYGVLEKDNSKKTGTKKTSTLEHTKEMVINFDTIRKKAYGSLTDDIENELAPKEKEIDEIEQEIDNILGENNLLSDLEEDKEVEPIVSSDLEEDNDEYNYKDFGVEYKIDEKVTRESKLKKQNKSIKDSKTVKDKDNDEDKEVELTEDLFNLIDSMYDR